MAEPSMVQRDWLIRINESLNNEHVNYPASLQVPTSLLDSNSAVYIPQFLSLGPYHHLKMEEDTKSSAGCKISRADEYKVKTAAIFSQKLRENGDNFNSIVQRMELMRPDIEGFYHCQATTDCEYSQNFTVMMAIDSSFLLYWLLSNPENDTIGLGLFQVCTRCDIMKLENQIPLFVLRNVFEAVFQENIEHFNELTWKRCQGLHPFLGFTGQIEVNDELEREPHLMGCVHALVSRFLRMEPDVTRRNGNRSLLKKLKGFSMELLIHLVNKFFSHCTTSIERPFLEAPNADQLHRAGIKFKMFNTFPNNIRFEVDSGRLSGTLYLPRISVTEMVTEVFFSNMVALELNDNTRPNYVTGYITLMASLVRSTDDVRLLKRRGIIETGIFGDRVSDECIANMWRGMCQPFFTGELGYQAMKASLSEVLEKNKLRTKIKRMLLGLFDYVSSWKFIAPLAGFLGLALTAIQAYPVLFK